MNAQRKERRILHTIGIVRAVTSKHCRRNTYVAGETRTVFPAWNHTPGATRAEVSHAGAINQSATASARAIETKGAAPIGNRQWLRRSTSTSRSPHGAQPQCTGKATQPRLVSAFWRQAPTLPALRHTAILFTAGTGVTQKHGITLRATDTWSVSIVDQWYQPMLCPESTFEGL